MGFRFRKSIKVLPGVRVNLGKSGVTGVNIGKRGAASVTVGRNGTHLNVGTPIDGLSYRERIGGGRTEVGSPYNEGEPVAPPAPLLEYDNATGEWRPQTSRVSPWLWVVIAVIVVLLLYLEQR